MNSDPLTPGPIPTSLEGHSQAVELQFQEQLHAVIQNIDQRDYEKGISQLRNWWRLFGIMLVVFLSLVIVIIGFLTVPYVQSTKSMSYTKINQGINEKFVVDLGKKVSAINVGAIAIDPNTKGQWHLQKGELLQSDRLVFSPAMNLIPGTRYTVKNIKVDRGLLGTEKIADISFKTEAAIGIKNEGSIALEDGSFIAADYAFNLSLRYQQNVDIRTTPSSELIKKVIDSQNIRWLPKFTLPQGQAIKVEVYNTKTDKVLASKQLQVAPEPKVSLSKTSYVKQGDTLILRFNEPIEKSSEKLISFVGLEGAGQWTSENEYSFAPVNLLPGKKYTVAVKNGLRTKKGGILTQDYSGEFSSTGPVSVVASTPKGYELPQASQLLSFTFDQPVDRTSAEQRFSINAGTVISKYWQNNTLYVKVSDLGYQKTVVATISPGIINADFGLPSQKFFSTNFTTEAKVFKYNVPLFRQQHTATCAAASLRMILAFRGVDTNEMSIVERMGYNPRPIDNSSNPPKWDDPDEMFVGAIDGSIEKGTSAGPDAGPVAKAANGFGRNATKAVGINADWVATQLSNGRLVVLFGVTRGTNSFITWQTPSGRITKMNTYSHARVVIGVKGEPGSTLGFWINDPRSSITQFWTTNQLTADINQDPYQQAVSID